MSIGLIIWLIVLMAGHTAMYVFWLNIKDQTSTGYLTDLATFLFLATILVIANVSTIATLIFKG